MPLSRLRMLGVGGVVSAVQGPAVVADGVAVVARARHAVRVAGQAEPRQRECHGRAQLLSSREPLEVDHQYLGKSVQCVSFCALSSSLAGFTCLKLQTSL